MGNFEASLDEVLGQIRSVMIDRHEKYGAGNITATPFGAEVGLVVRLNDKLARLSNLIRTGDGSDAKDESEMDTATDIAGYGIIYMMVKQGLWPGTGKGE